ncbi:O-antigen ligase family protein [Nocardioidaceae bacterium]|nr:O-antigen ligase family protein [Nocardioidaceae bacterium]
MKLISNAPGVNNESAPDGAYAGDRPPKLLIVSVALVPLDALGVDVAGQQIRLYMLFAAAGIFLHWMKIFRGGRSNVSRQPVIWLGLLTIMSLASAGWSEARDVTLVVAFGQIFLFVWMLVTISCFADLKRARLPYLALLTGLQISVSISCMQVLLSLGGYDFGVWRNVGIPWARPTGLTAEPVWAALNASILFLMMSFSSQHLRRRRVWVLLSLFVLVMTFSRAAIVATLVAYFAAMLFSFFTSKNEEQFRRNIARLLLATVTLFSAIVVAYPFVPESIKSRFALILQLSNPSSLADGGSYASRNGIQRYVFDNWSDSAWVGHGVGSLEPVSQDPSVRQLYAGGGELNSGAGSTNFFFTHLYDLGLIGLAFSILFALSLFVAAVALRGAGTVPFAITMSLVVQFSASNGFRLGVAWIAVAVAFNLARHDYAAGPDSPNVLTKHSVR